MTRAEPQDTAPLLSCYWAIAREIHVASRVDLRFTSERIDASVQTGMVSDPLRFLGLVHGWVWCSGHWPATRRIPNAPPAELRTFLGGGNRTACAG